MKTIHKDLIEQTSAQIGIRPTKGNDEFMSELIDTVIQKVLGTISLHALANFDYGSEMRDECGYIIKNIERTFEVDSE